MNDKPTAPGANAVERDQGGDRLEPLPGEPGIPDVARPARVPMSKKGLLAVGLLVASLVAVSALSLQRFATSGRNSGDAASARVGDRPAAAGAEPRRLEMPSAPASASSTPSQAVRIPQLIPTAEETAEPIGVHRTGSARGTGNAKSIPPQDAPVLVLTTRPGSGKAGRGDAPASDQAVSGDATGAGDPLEETRRNLVAYQRQLEGLLDTLNKGTAAASRQGAVPPLPLGASPTGVPSSGGATNPPPTGALFGGQLQASATPRVTASMLGNRSLTLPKGTAFTCALKTKVISAASGFVGCQVLRNVFSDDGRVLLIERGSHMDGEYRVASFRSGTVRIPVLWTRIRTPKGVTVDIDSPGTGPLGESGVDGYVDNRWVERIGAALLLSLINDSVQFVLQSQANDSSGDTIILPSTTSSTNKLAEKVLENTINIPPLIYQNQGGIVGIYVA
ncbi:MAG: type IV secretion system protein VirB10, partial [Burkholderiaceae bacterium]|nr:type IV secretion system protein VirB10 [Burkholderiaceae bacterium]